MNVLIIVGIIAILLFTVIYVVSTTIKEKTGGQNKTAPAVQGKEQQTQAEQMVDTTIVKKVVPETNYPAEAESFAKDFQWEIKSGIYYLVCKRTGIYNITRLICMEFPYSTDTFIDSSFSTVNYFKIHIKSPINGIGSWLLSDDYKDEWDVMESRDLQIQEGQAVLKIDPTEEGQRAFDKRHEERRLKIQAEKEQKERDEITKKILAEEAEKRESQRLKELEIKIRQELIDKGEIEG